MSYTPLQQVYKLKLVGIHLPMHKHKGREKIKNELKSREIQHAKLKISQRPLAIAVTSDPSIFLESQTGAVLCYH